jgi:hypothetical protein
VLYPFRNRDKNKTLAALALVAVAALLALPGFAASPARAGASPPTVGLGVTEVPDTIRVLMPDGSVQTFDMDEYLKGVVPTEVDPSWHMDALQAQAVAARCYACSMRHSNANVCTTTHCQAWTSARDPRTDLAVDSTHKVAARYGGEVIDAFYFGHCDGRTRNSEDVWSEYLPYCRSVSCPCGNKTLFGHGVGMCQDGTEVLAAAGWDYKDILKHYYTGATVESTEKAAVNWYFAEGTTRPGFVTYFCIANPSDSPADVTLTYLMDDGQSRQGTLTVAQRSRATVDAAADVGAGRDFSCRIASDNGVAIVAERPMYFNYGGAWTGGHDTMGATGERADWYFAEGTTRRNFVTYFCIANNTDAQAAVTVSYFMDSGDSKDILRLVEPHSRATIDASSDVGFEKDFSCRVSSTNGVGIVAERPMYFNYAGAITGGHDAMGASEPRTDWYFAEGTTRRSFASYLCVANPGAEPASITITYMTSSASPLKVRHTVGPRSRKTVLVSDDIGYDVDFSCRVTSTNRVGIVAERPMYFKYGGAWTGGHDTIGTPYPKTEWYFAEGSARPGFVTYVCVQNTSDKAADIRIDYLKGDGGTARQNLEVSPGARATICANDTLGTAPDSAHDFALKVTSVNNAAIVVERPMYFNYGGAWTGGHDTMGY